MFSIFMAHRTTPNIVLFWMMLGLFSCTSGNRNAISYNSTSVDSVLLGSFPDEQELPFEEIEETDSVRIEVRYEELSRRIAGQVDSFYTVTIVTNEYESGSDVTWYFDRSYSPQYFKEVWSMEGTSGTTEYLIEDNTVRCVQEEESYGWGSATTLWCSDVGGKKTSYAEESEEPTTEKISSSYAGECQHELERYLSILKELLKEGEINEEEDNTYTVRLENVMTIGPEQEFTQYTEVNIPKKLYDKLTE